LNELTWVLRWRTGGMVHWLLDRFFYHRLVVTPLRSLAGHDARGGHTTPRHIGLTLARLNHRLASDPGVFRASSFWDEITARVCVNQAISSQLDQILPWLATSNLRLVLTSQVPVRSSIGVRLDRNGNVDTQLRRVRVVLRKDTASAATDFFVLTAFPI
jgi:Bacterial CdiA-CT RNAse A domain